MSYYRYLFFRAFLLLAFILVALPSLESQNLSVESQTQSSNSQSQESSITQDFQSLKQILSLLKQRQLQRVESAMKNEDLSENSSTEIESSQEKSLTADSKMENSLTELSNSSQGLKGDSKNYDESVDKTIKAQDDLVIALKNDRIIWALVSGGIVAVLWGITSLFR